MPPSSLLPPTVTWSLFFLQKANPRASADAEETVWLNKNKEQLLVCSVSHHPHFYYFLPPSSIYNFSPSYICLTQLSGELFVTKKAWISVCSSSFLIENVFCFSPSETLMSINKVIWLKQINFFLCTVCWTLYFEHVELSFTAPPQSQYTVAPVYTSDALRSHCARFRRKLKSG